MFFPLPEELAGEVSTVESLLSKHNPWPRAAMARLTRLAADTPQRRKRFSDFRLTVVDIEDLLHGCRWAIGNGLLLIRVSSEPSSASEPESQFERIGVPARVQLLLSGFLAGRDRVIFRDLQERHPSGGKVGSWMIRILADHAVTSSIAVLDRLAQLLVFASGAKPPRNRMYFREGKLRLLRDQGAVAIPDSILALAASEDLGFLLQYRDGLAHTLRLNTTALGAPAVEEYLDEDGTIQRTKSALWSSEELVGIGLMAFELVRSALEEVGTCCEAHLSPTPVDAEQ